MKNTCECCGKEVNTKYYELPLKPSLITFVTLELCEECSNKSYKDYDIVTLICTKIINEDVHYGGS